MHTTLIDMDYSDGLQEGGVGLLGGYEKENGTEQKLGTKEDIQMTDYMFNSKCHKEVQIQTVRNHHTPVRVAKIQHSHNTKRGQGCGATRTHPHCCGNVP